MSSEKDLRKRLAALNREPLPDRPKEDAEVAEMRRKLRKQREKAGRAEAEQQAQQARQAQPPQPSQAAQPPGAILYRRDLPQPSAKQYERAQAGPPVVLAEAVTGSEVDGPIGGKAFVISTDVSRIDKKAARVCKTYEQMLSQADSSSRLWLAGQCGAPDAGPQDLVFFDIETTGLGAGPLFLIGAMYCESGRLVVRQYFARTYAEERAVIALFLRSFEDRKLLVSFNGKTFDLPYVRVRSAATGVPFDFDPPHFDLLHVSRRIWSGRLPNCKLQTLERIICGRLREGDIPGDQIPQAYHDYVRTGDARDMVECLKHNMLDLVTLADLMLRLPKPG
ncbi:MAG: ribonuclease H-like domain-containing protein [Planctomycetota bacterium]